MPLIRLQNNVPPTYVEQSRDFQLLCRLYDVILNGIKFDIDSITRLSNTAKCGSTSLKLLQTKLGFLSRRSYTDDTIRIILEAFPLLVKSKGTKIAIEECLYMYLKAVGMEAGTGIEVDIIGNDVSDLQQTKYGSNITDHCVVICIENDYVNMVLLKDVLRYIVPFGYNTYFYLYERNSMTDSSFYSYDKVQMLLVSNDVNDTAGSTVFTDLLSDAGISSSRWDTTHKWYSEDVTAKLVSAVNTTETRKASEEFNTDTALLEPIYDTQLGEIITMTDLPEAQETTQDE